MARTVNHEEFALKRKEILDAALRLVFSKGYEQMSIQDILDDLKISSGAFHHYFDSRFALLTALTEHMQGEVEQQLLPIVRDPRRSALQKLQSFFDTLDRLRVAQKAMVVDLMHVWFADDNAVLRQKVDEMNFERRAPLITQIVRQGVQEGAFTIPYPDQAGEIVLSLVQGMANTHAKLLLSLMHKHSTSSGDQQQATLVDNSAQIVNRIVTTHAAYMAAIERVLGAPHDSLVRVNPQHVKMWVVALCADAAQGDRT